MHQCHRALATGGEDAVCAVAGTGLHGLCCPVCLLDTTRYPHAGSKEPSEFQFLPAQLKVDYVSRAALPDMVAVSHMCLLRAWNVAHPH